MYGTNLDAAITSHFFRITMPLQKLFFANKWPYSLTRDQPSTGWNLSPYFDS